MPRKTIIAGNWKMNLLPEEAEDLVLHLKQNLTIKEWQEVVVIPQPALIPIVSNTIMDSGIQLGSQNNSSFVSGAYTGESSPALLKALGCQYGLTGHSERRQYFGEDDNVVGGKTNALLSLGMTPIVCVGESLEERESGKLWDVIKKQVSAIYDAVEKPSWSDIMFAYEPVWAIGTGKTASPEEANEVHQFIRKLVTETAGDIIGISTCILYGGSAKPDNAKELLSKSDIDGLLIGGASLKASDFLKIISLI